MKKILILILLNVSFATISQTVNGLPIEKIDQEYIRIVGTMTIKGKISVDIDFGQNQKHFTKKDTKIIGKDGKKIKFNSMVDALNFMHDYNYKLVQAYAINVDKVLGNQTVYHYLMQKKSN